VNGGTGLREDEREYIRKEGRKLILTEGKFPRLISNF
jgi:hypothetical protein